MNVYEIWYVYHSPWSHLICVLHAMQRLVKHSIFARQRPDKNVTATTNTQATIEKVLDTLFSMGSISHQGM
jgi:hypothetical protein